MKQIIIALSIVLLFTGCVQNKHKPVNHSSDKHSSVSASQFNWATADFRKLENKVYKIVERNNPYPDASLDKREIQAERSRISRQISSLRRSACDASKTKRQNNKRYGQDCYSQTENNPRIVELNKQLQKVDKLSRKLYAHADKLRAFAKDQTTAIVQGYSVGKYEVVVRQGRDNVIYNQHGIAIDITDALMQEINESKLTMRHQTDKVTNTK